MTSYRCLVLLSLVVGVSALAIDDAMRQWLVKGAPDPAIVKAHDGSGFYIFATGEGVAIWLSQDLKQWKKIGRVFDEAVPDWAKKTIPGADSIWAPEIRYAHGKYWLYYSVSTFGSQRSVIGLAVNETLDPKSPKYRWHDRGLVIDSFPKKNDYNAIDPAVLFDDDGKAYLYWGSYWTGLKACEIDPQTGKPSSSQPKTIAIAARAKVGPPDIEAPSVIKRDGYYYLFVSWDFCCAKNDSSYKIMVGRSRSPLGPFVDERERSMTGGHAKLVLMGDRRWRGPGHNSVLQTAKSDWLVYHVIDAKDPDGGRILQIRPLKWRDGWPIAGNPVAAPAGKPMALVGRWSHTVNDRDHYDIFFEPGGLIRGTKGEARWELEGNRLLMKWKDPRAPGGYWVDQVKVAGDQHAYNGVNQNGISIRGRYVTR